MPVPKSSVESSPRKLLRDVVLEKMLAAIQDGTLQAGERLNDDELVAWLGVSRTPVREAIAKLADQAILEIEANRYTKVTAPDFEEFLDTVEIGYHVWSLYAERAVPKLTDEQLAHVLRVLDDRLAAFESEKTEDPQALDEMNAVLLEASGSAGLVRLAAASGPRLLVLVRRTHSAGHFPWDAARTFTRALRDAFADRRADEVGRLIREQPDTWGEYLEAVRASGIFPEKG